MAMYMNSEDVLVISGISGRFPECEDIEIFSKRLLSGECFTTFDERRWPKGSYNLPEGVAKLADIDKFDAQFFGYSEEEANVLDPANRFLLEETYACICDAGLSPESLRGSNTGFFYGSWIDKEVEEAFRYEVDSKIDTFSYAASRVPYHMDLKGPVCYMNNACASSLTATQLAVAAIRCGQCERAFVVASNITLNPTRLYWQNQMNTLAPDSVCKLWDEDADGYVKGEAVIVILIQKKPEAKRIYAHVLAVRSNADGQKKEGLTFPGWKTQQDLIMATMKDARITGNDFAFFEAHGTGTQAGDPVETKSIARAVCSSRDTPLIIGSIKATIGHTEGASGLASIAKVIIAYQKGLMAPTLNYKKPNTKIPELFDGTITICDKPMPFEGGIVGLNNFGIGGANASGIISSFDEKRLTNESYDICNPIPRLVLICGRNNGLVEQKVSNLVNKSKTLTKEFLSLLNESSNERPENGMKSRGFAIFGEEKKCVNSSVGNCLVEGSQRRPLWFVFTGLGSEWSSMAKSLMEIEIFAKSFERSLAFLESIGADVKVLKEFLLDSDTDIEIKPIIPTLAVLQIGFVDLLTELGVRPDAIIAHSVGETVAAYADGCITAEDALRISHSMHTMINADRETATAVSGVMAAVGLSWAEAQKRCFGTVFVACNNSPNMVTMTGNVADMDKLFDGLTNDKIFHIKVENHGIAAHSPLMARMEAKLTVGARRLGIKPNRRTKWMSTTYKDSEWDDPLCQWPSGEYFVKNLCNPVLFYDTIVRAPKNTLFVEIGPSDLLRHSVGKSFQRDHNIIYKEFMRRNNNPNNVLVTLSALGQLYISGRTVDISKLYPKVEYPVPRGTDFISPLIKWDHNKSYFVTKYPDYFYPKISKSVKKHIISMVDDRYLADHKIDGRILYPGVGYIYLGWKTVASALGITDLDDFAVEFTNLKLHQATNLTNDEVIVKCSYFRDSYHTTIEANDTIICECLTKPLSDRNQLAVDQTDRAMVSANKIYLTANDFYKEVRVRGYDYGPNFQGIVSLSKDGSEAQVKWTGHLISFLDSVMQMILLDDDKRFLRVPTRIECLRFDPKMLFADRLKSGESEFVCDVYYDKNTNEARSHGLYMKNVSLTSISRKLNQTGELVLEKYVLTPYDETNAIDQSLAQEIDGYLRQCDITAQKVTDLRNNSLQTDDNNNDINNNLGTDKQIETNDNHVLLKHIRDLLNTTNYNENDVSINLDNDLVYSTLLSERFLRPQLDVFVENSDLNKKISILEINTSQQIFFNTAMKLIGRTAPGSVINNVEYTLCHSDKASLPQTLLDSKRIKILDYDMDKSVVPYQRLSPQNLIIFRDPNISAVDSKITLEYDSLLRSMQTALTDGGFLLVVLRNKVLSSEKAVNFFETSAVNRTYEKFLESAEEAGLQYVFKKSDSIACCSLLFRKLERKELNETHIHISIEDLQWLEPLKTAMKDESLDRIWLTSGEEFNGITGLLKGLQKEENGWKVRTVLYDSRRNVCESVLKTAKETDLVQNVFGGERWGSFRHISLPELPESRATTSAQVRQLKSGDLSSFKWSDSPNSLWPLNKTSENQILIDVYYSPLNFKDVMHATARLPPSDLTSHMAWDDVVLGLEFVGRIRESGERVMGLNSSKALSTDIVVDKNFLWTVPDRWSMAEAATVPCVYATAFYALIIRGRLKRGETVLIHAGTGGVGQAAINICLAMDCKVFTTVGTQEKRDWIRKCFPQLTESCIASSRDVSFERRVLEETNGRGVDLILNSLTDQMFWASLRCLANDGRFCEIGKYQFVNNDDLDSSHLLKNKTFHGIYLDALFGGLNNLITKKIDRERQWMWQLVQDGIKSGVVKPLPQTVFSVDDTEKAFRFMATGKHIGKVLIRIRSEEPEIHSIARPLTINAIPLTFFSPKKSYVIAGGLGGMGLELMYWMYERNARNFVLTSRSGVKSATHEFAITRLKERNCKVIVSKSDASTVDGAQQILSKAQQLGPIGGLFLLTLVLEDDLIENQTIERYERVMNAKSTQALVLDSVTRKMTKPIDYFVAFSSCSCGRGITGQTNYAFANSVLERICEKRRSDGLHGLAIQWGFVGDVGVAADNYDETSNRAASILGYLPQRIISCWLQLDRFLQSDHSVCSSFVRYDSYDKDSNSKASLLESICNILGLKDMSSLDANTKLADLGMDSLMSVEVKNMIERESQLSMSAKEVANLSIKQLRDGINA